MLRAAIILGDCTLGLLVVATAFIGEPTVYAIAAGVAGAFMVGMQLGVAISRADDQCPPP